MELRIATFNIYWYPSSSFVGNRRSEADRGKIREVIRRLDADVLVFQEILDLADLEDLLSHLIPTRSYRLRDTAGRWTASGADQQDGMKVVVAFDGNRLELVEAGTARMPDAAPASKGRRDPVAARLRVPGGTPFTVIGVHLKSGVLTVGSKDTTPDDDVRIEEMRGLTEWITTAAPIGPGGKARQADEPTVLIGDFNAVRGNAALRSLVPGGALSSWSWPAPRFASAMLPSPQEAPLPEIERWTTHLDRMVIDHVIASPKTKVVDGPWVYAFDHDESWMQAAGVTREWLGERDYPLTPEKKSADRIENLHRISDHRPVRVTIEL